MPLTTRSSRAQTSELGRLRGLRLLRRLLGLELRRAGGGIRGFDRRLVGAAVAGSVIRGIARGIIGIAVIAGAANGGVMYL